MFVYTGATSHTTQQAVYQQCLDAKIIDRALFFKLTQASDKRNSCLHSYVHSNADYDSAAHLVFDVDDRLDAVKKAIDKLENQQVAKEVGMARSGSEAPKELKDFLLGKGKPN